MAEWIDNLFNNDQLKKIKIVQASWERANPIQSGGMIAYFLLLSLVPFLLIVANVIPLFPIDAHFVLDILSKMLPEDVHKIIAPILVNYLNNSHSGGTISIALLTTMWSAGAVFRVLQTVLNNLYGTVEKKNIIVNQVISFLLIAALLLLIMVSMGIFIFGENLLIFASEFFPIANPTISSFLYWRWIIIVIFLLFFFMIVYHIVPNHHLSAYYAIPGAVFSTIGWLLSAQIFSFYTSIVSSEMLANATIGGFIGFMLFLYFLSVILLFGGMINTIVFELKTGQSVTAYEKELTAGDEFTEKDVVILSGNLKKITD